MEHTHLGPSQQWFRRQWRLALPPLHHMIWAQCTGLDVGREVGHWQGHCWCWFNMLNCFEAVAGKMGVTAAWLCFLFCVWHFSFWWKSWPFSSSYSSHFPAQGVPWPGVWREGKSGTNGERNVDWLALFGQLPGRGPATLWPGRSHFQPLQSFWLLLNQ